MRAGCPAAPARRSDDLAEAADFFIDLNARDFRRAQLPDPVVPDGSGTPISCPFEWLSIERKAERLNAAHQAVVTTVLSTIGHARRNLVHHLVDELYRAEQK